MSVVTVLEELHRAYPCTGRINLENLDLEVLAHASLDVLKTRFPNLRYLNLRGNALTDLPVDFASFVPKLVALDLQGNNFQSIPRVSEALAPCSYLQSLRITLRNKTDERVLRVMLPKLRVLNGGAVNDSDVVAARPPSLSLDLIDTSSSSSGSVDSTSPSMRWLDTPPSTAASVIRPVHSPQETREFRLQFAKQSVKSPSPKRGHSVRPTEIPATISDERTDWRKLLKKTKTNEAEPPSNAVHVRGPSKAVTVDRLIKTQPRPTEPVSTRAFISKLKSIIHSFHTRSDQHGKEVHHASKSTEEQVLFDQLERQIDSLAFQLNSLEKQPRQESGKHDGHVVAASLEARWRLVEAGVSYAARKATSVDKELGSGLQRLAETQAQVVEALLRHVNEAIDAQQKWEAASRSQESVAEQQKQQMRLLLDVAETLEKDLEALQAKYQAEKTQREQAEATSRALLTECDTLRKQVEGKRSNPRPAPVEPSDKPGSSFTQRRIRKRTELTQVPTNRPPSPVDHRQRTGVAPPSPKANTSPASPGKNATVQPVVRTLTLKQLVDLIHCILASKVKYDSRLQSIGAAPETMEQHMYTYLNQRFGLQPLIVEYASAIWKGCQAYTRQDNDVAMFHAMLRNQVDEDFVGIKKKLQLAVKELLRAYFHAKNPMKPEATIQQMVDERLHGGLLNEGEWTELLMYLYDPSDSSLLLRLVKRKAEAYTSQQQHQQKNQSRQQRQSNEASVLPFSVFEKLLYDYQLQGRLRLLEGFRQVFATYDSDRVSVLSRQKFRDLVDEIAPRKSGQDIDKMIEKLDPFNHDTITFSNAVRCLLHDIRQQSLSRKTAHAKSR